MHVIYALQPLPSKVTKTLFLAGPTPRGNEGQTWREKAIQYLRSEGFDGHVFVPEPPDSKWAEDYDDQVTWEQDALERADVIVFWVPRDIKGKMPGFTTNDEWGAWKASGKVVWGNPPGADNVRYQQFYAKQLGVPMASSLEDTLKLALDKVGEGAAREDGEALVPLHIWSREDFQAWYRSQKAAGNELHGFEVVWTFWVGEKRDRLFLYAAHATVWVKDENRTKSIECFVSRPDLSVVCLYRKNPLIGMTRIALIKEFRTPVRNKASMVYELPGGSSLKPGTDALQTAADEVSEEVGLLLTPDRLKAHGSRQMGATLVSYHAHLYSVELTDLELAGLEDDDEVHGEDDEERTYVVVRTLNQIQEEGLLDWPMLGMIAEALREDG